jgi:anti-sigma regulatory factor (Ser/Thr protein kinase)
VPDGDSAIVEPPRFTHSAFLYDDQAAYLAFLIPFIGEGLDRDESVAVAASTDRIALLRDTLGADAGPIHFLPADEWYVRPQRTVGAWARLLRTAAAAGRPSTRLINEIVFAAADRPWVRCESALNRALQGLNGHLLCPYDRGALPAQLIASAGQTHHLLYDAGWHHSDTYQEPELLLTELTEPPHPAGGEPVITMPIAGPIAGLRTLVRDRASAEHWLAPDRIDTLVLALSEITTNAVRHGGPNRELRLWLTGNAVVCEVSDDGADPPGPLAGYLPPTPGAVGGMGLWLVGQVCDSLTVRAEAGHTRARFALRR